MRENIDFSDCEFINEQMKIYTFYDFCDNRKILKKLYNNLPRNSKRFYMWYIYANIHMKMNFKNAIWDYLNGYKTDDDLLHFKKIYHEK